MKLQLKEITSLKEARKSNGMRALVYWSQPNKFGYLILGFVDATGLGGHAYINKDGGTPDVIFYSDGRRAEDTIGYVIEGLSKRPEKQFIK